MICASTTFFHMVAFCLWFVCSTGHWPLRYFSTLINQNVFHSLYVKFRSPSYSRLLNRISSTFQMLFLWEWEWERERLFRLLNSVGLCLSSAQYAINVFVVVLFFISMVRSWMYNVYRDEMGWNWWFDVRILQHTIFLELARNTTELLLYKRVVDIYQWEYWNVHCEWFPINLSGIMP